MNGQRVGYIRVSSAGQNTDRQLDGLPLSKIFTDHASGKDCDRIELELLQEYVRDGDTVVIHSMDRLARNLDHLRRLVQDFTGRGVRVEFIKEGLTFSGDDGPMSVLMLSLMGAFAEFERSLILERQREGIAIAKKAGKYKGRRKALAPEQIAEIQERAGRNESKAKIARDLGVSRQTVYGYLKGEAVKVEGGPDACNPQAGASELEQQNERAER